MFYRVWVVKWAVLIKNKIKPWALFSIEQWRFKSFIHGPQLEPPYPLPYPQKLSDRTGFAQNFGLGRSANLGHKQPHTHTYFLASPHTHTLTHALTHIYTLSHSHTCTHTTVFVWLCIWMYVFMCTRADLCVCLRASLRACVTWKRRKSWFSRS